MDHTFCPGSRLIRQPKPESITCPSCGEDIEIWSDEVRATCTKCHKTVMRNGYLSCLDWCKMGKECVGEEAYNKYVVNKAVTVRERLLQEMCSFFGDDAKRITHAKEVLRFAEELLNRESGDWHIVVPAAILHDVGIKVAEEKYGSAAGHLQEQEGPPVARKIMLKADMKKEHVDEVCAIIAHHHSPGPDETQNFRVLYDADMLVNIRETLDAAPAAQRSVLMERSFLTAAGKELSSEMQAVDAVFQTEK